MRFDSELFYVVTNTDEEVVPFAVGVSYSGAITAAIARQDHIAEITSHVRRKDRYSPAGTRRQKWAWLRRHKKLRVELWNARAVGHWSNRKFIDANPVPRIGRN